MGWFGENVFGPLGAAVGSIWDKEKEVKDIGRAIGKVIPFRRGGSVMMPNTPAPVFFSKGGIVQRPPPPPPVTFSDGGFVFGPHKPSKFVLYANGGMVEMEKPKRKRRSRK